SIERVVVYSIRSAGAGTAGDPPRGPGVGVANEGAIDSITGTPGKKRDRVSRGRCRASEDPGTRAHPAGSRTNGSGTRSGAGRRTRGRPGSGAGGSDRSRAHRS